MTTIREVRAAAHHEVRALPGTEIRAVDEQKRQFTATVCVYGVPDSYGTVWAPGCWTEWLTRKLPVSVWSHDWSDPIGVVIDYVDTEERLDVVVQLDPFEDVPRARQCFAQLKSGSMREFSFGFARLEWSELSDEAAAEYEGKSPYRAYEIMTKARMDEVSPVLVGAVPGTALLSVRSAQRVSRQEAGALLTQVAAGAMPLSEALRSLEGAEEAEPVVGDVQPVSEPADPLEAVRAALAEVDLSGVPQSVRDALDLLLPATGETEPEPVDQAALDASDEDLAEALDILSRV